MPLELAQRTFTVRGLHASSLRGLLMRNARLRVTTEVEDAKGMGAVRVEDKHGVFVGHLPASKRRLCNLCSNFATQKTSKFAPDSFDPSARP